MAWTLYVFTRGGIEMYVDSYASEAAARAAAKSGIKDGYFDIPDANPLIPDWIWPLASAESFVFRVVDEVDPGPNIAGTDIVDGLDILV